MSQGESINNQDPSFIENHKARVALGVATALLAAGGVGLAVERAMHDGGGANHSLATESSPTPGESVSSLPSPAAIETPTPAKSVIVTPRATNSPETAKPTPEKMPQTVAEVMHFVGNPEAGQDWPTLYLGKGDKRFVLNGDIFMQPSETAEKTNSIQATRIQKPVAFKVDGKWWVGGAVGDGHAINYRFVELGKNTSLEVYDVATDTSTPYILPKDGPTVISTHIYSVGENGNAYTRGADGKPECAACTPLTS